MPDLVILAVDDLARAVSFYRIALGFMPAIETPVYVELREGIGLYQRDGFARNVGEEAGRVSGITATELYFRVPDVDVACARLTSAGGRLLSGLAPRPWGERVAYYADPDGNVVAVAQAPVA